METKRASLIYTVIRMRYLRTGQWRWDRIQKCRFYIGIRYIRGRVYCKNHVLRAGRGRVTPGQLRVAGVEGDTRGSNAEVGSTAQRTGLTNPAFRVSLNKSLSLERTNSGSEISLGTILSTALSVWLRVIRRSWCCFARSLSRRICAGDFRL